MSAIKEAVLDLARQLPEQCTWDDVMDLLYVRQKIAAGIADADAGRVVSHDEVVREFARVANSVDGTGPS